MKGDMFNSNEREGENMSDKAERKKLIGHL
jgi:hypothetical protein